MDLQFKQQIEEYLDALPSKWAEQLAEILCQIREDRESVDCNKVKECETVTSLSDFSLSGTTVSIKYTDENGVQVTRSFDLGTTLNGTLDDLQPNCLATPEQWNSLSYAQRLQLLIDAHCSCCGTALELDPVDTLVPYNDCVADPGTGTSFSFTFTITNGVGPVEVDGVVLFANPHGGSINFTAPSTVEYTSAASIPLADLSSDPPIVEIDLDGQLTYLPLLMIDQFTQCE